MLAPLSICETRKGDKRNNWLQHLFSTRLGNWIPGTQIALEGRRQSATITRPDMRRVFVSSLSRPNVACKGRMSEW